MGRSRGNIFSTYQHHTTIGHITTCACESTYDKRHHCLSIGMVFGIADIDEADGFPRYYMDEERAQLELAAWLHHRMNN